MFTPNGLPVHIFSTAPQSSKLSHEEYVTKLINVARWSEEAGCTGMLVYTDNGLVDPWLVAQIVLQHTTRLCPLVAVQPVYMHPYTVAKMVASLWYMHGRKIYLNMVAGGFRTDLLALCDDTPHDRRYERLVEYTTIIKALLSDGKPFTFKGEFYRVKDLVMKPPLPSEFLPGICLSGSSEAGMAAAETLEAIAVEYPKPGEEYRNSEPREKSGIRIGIISDEDEERAWKVAYERFPFDRKGQITHKIAMKVSDSQWHKQLSRIAHESVEEHNTYWLWPFQNYSTFCPYLVGSREQVSREIAKYLRAGFVNFILDIPAEENDLRSACITFHKAAETLRSHVESGSI